MMGGANVNMTMGKETAVEDTMCHGEDLERVLFGLFSFFVFQWLCVLVDDVRESADTEAGDDLHLRGF